MGQEPEAKPKRRQTGAFHISLTLTHTFEAGGEFPLVSGAGRLLVREALTC